MMNLNYEPIPMDFWHSLGQYVYGYVAPGSDQVYVYIGKGNGNRAITHTKTKNYNIEDLVIIARNLENFDRDKQDLQSFIVESLMISLNNPADNSISGHYKECFVMAKFSQLFNEFTKNQHDNFESLPSWFTDNYSKFAGRLNVVSIKSHLHTLKFQTRQQMQVMLDVYTDGSIMLRVAIWTNDDQNEQLALRLSQLKKFCSELDISEDQIIKPNEREIYTIDIDDLDHALQFIDDFYS